MPKPKQFLQSNKKKSKHAPTAPETADEYLAAGVDFEEAGEKWRGGDAAKSTRFFVRAIDCYEEALKNFPNSFDLAYNKARVQYELTQHPKLLEQLPGSLLDLLQTALESSRYALRLNGENADALFNTAQVLTSISEKISETPSDASAALPLVEEALTLFQQCLELQEKQARESASQQQAMEAMIADSNSTTIPITESSATAKSDDDSGSENGGIALSGPSSATSMDVENNKSSEDDRWATIVEPVTNEVLLETVLAQLEALAQLCGQVINVSQDAISWIDNYAKELIEVKLSSYASPDGLDIEALIIRATFISAFSNLQFQANLISVKHYADAITAAYKLPPNLDLNTSAEALCSYAESLISFNAAVRFVRNNQENLQFRWSALSNALKYLTTASKIPGVDNIVKIHIARGDVEVLRFQLGQTEIAFKVAVDNGNVLLGNAGKFYIGAKNNADFQGMGEEGFEAQMKECLARGLLGQGAALNMAVEKLPKSRALVAEMVDEGLVTSSQLAGMGING